MKRKVCISVGVVVIYDSVIETELTDEEINDLLEKEKGKKIWRTNPILGQFEESNGSQDLRLRTDEMCIEDISDLI